MSKEIETKFKIKNGNALRKALKEIGAEFISKKLERDVYYRAPATVRLRSLGKNGIFTVKTPSCSGQSCAYKVRDEFEVAVGDAKMFARMFEILGFAVRFKKEKIRETYAWRDAKILIDKLPYIGYYAEIEGPKKRIRHLAGALGLDLEKAIPDTYGRLFDYYKMRHGKRDLEMTFRR